MESIERFNKIIEKSNLKYIIDEVYNSGCAVSLATFKYILEKDFSLKEILEYIEESTENFSDDVKLLYVESLIELRKLNERF